MVGIPPVARPRRSTPSPAAAPARSHRMDNRWRPGYRSTIIPQTGRALMIRTRLATSEDRLAVQELLGQLGYVFSAEDVQARLILLAASGTDPVLVATRHDEVVGLIALQFATMLHLREPVARITALVVRDGGAGRRNRSGIDRCRRCPGTAGGLRRSGTDHRRDQNRGSRLLQKAGLHKLFPSLQPRDQGGHRPVSFCRSI